LIWTRCDGKKKKPPVGQPKRGEEIRRLWVAGGGKEGNIPCRGFPTTPLRKGKGEDSLQQLDLGGGGGTLHEKRKEKPSVCKHVLREKRGKAARPLRPRKTPPQKKRGKEGVMGAGRLLMKREAKPGPPMWWGRKKKKRRGVEHSPCWEDGRGGWL